MHIIKKIMNRPEVAGWGVLAIIFCIIGFNLINRQSYTDLHHSVDTIYEDRLMPAVYIYEMTDLVHFNRLYLDRHLRATYEKRKNEISQQVFINHLKIDSLLYQYNQTFLTEHESVVFSDLKNMLLDLRRMEKTLLQWENPQVNLENLEIELDQLFQTALNDLKLLALEQQTVGQEIKKSTSTVVAGTSTLADLELSILFVLLILFKFSIYRATRSLKSKKEYINWN